MSGRGSVSAVYSYTTPSALRRADGGGELALATSGGVTEAGPVPHPYFYSGFLAEPGPDALGMLAVSAIARARYFDASRWAYQAGRTLALGATPRQGAACLASPERLVELRPLLRFAARLRVYAPPAGAASLPAPSAWELTFAACPQPQIFLPNGSWRLCRA